MEQFLKVFVGILASLAVVLGFFIVVDYLPEKDALAPGEQGMVRDYASMSPQEQRETALTPPKGNSLKEQKQFAEFVHTIAVETNTLDATECQMEPVVLKMKRGNAIVLENNGSEERRVIFGEEQILIIAPHARQTVVPSVPIDISLFGYGCDLILGRPAGMLFVAE